MTSRRSKDNATTDDWRSQKDGLYFDSTWPADSQGRKQPASTQITVTPSSSILETSRAAQAANRETLDRRENEAKTKAEAVQEIKKEEAEQKANKKEVTRGVPENKTRTVLPKRKGSKPIFSWIIQEFKEKFASFNVRLEVVGSELSASGNIMTLPSAFEIYRFFDPLEFVSGQFVGGFQLPSNHVIYDREIKSNPFPGNDELLHVQIVEASSDRLYFEVKGTLQAEGSSEPWRQGIDPEPSNYRERYLWSIGIFFDARKMSKPSYVYFFAKKNSTEGTTLLELRNVDEGFNTLAGLHQDSKYPQPKHISGDSSRIYIERIEFTPQTKEIFMNISTDTFSQPTQRRTFEWNRVGTHDIDGELTSIRKSNLLILTNPSGGESVYVQFEFQAVSFDDQIELIYTDKDYGELIWAE